MKLLIVLVSTLLLSSVLFLSFYYDSNEEVIEEDISSYHITNKYECKQIQDDEEFTKCVQFWVKRNPYEIGDQLVITNKE